MNEPVFLSREAVDLIHESSLRAFGGADGVRDDNALESALAQPMHEHFYRQADLYQIAAAYAFHIAENQPYIDASGVDNGTDLIHVAFVFRTQTVTPVGAPAALTNRYFTGISRPPLAQTFRERANNEVLTVTVNHFKSKASASANAAATDGLVPNPNLDQGDGQGASNYVRTRQAQALAQWLATDPTGSGDPDVLIIGDLNAYAKEDPITALRNAGFTNLTEVSEGATGYSYLFNGAFGHLDHALANARLAPRVVTAGTWYVNADEPDYYDYNVERKSVAQQAINTGTPYRYSDHDPVFVDLHLSVSTPTPPPPTPTPTPTPTPSGKSGGGGGAPSLWFAAALVALALLRRMHPARPLAG